MTQGIVQKIIIEDDQRKRQQDLNVIYKWAKDNNMMEFNEKKFE